MITDPTDQRAINEQLFRLGYLWHVKQDELLDLSPDDSEFRDAVLTIQDSFRDEYEVLTNLHNTPNSREGRPGPALVDLLNTPRCCPLPDVPPPPGVRFAFDDPDVQRAVESQQRAAEIMAAKSDSRGSGSWPYGCWDGFEMHRLVVAVKHDSMPAAWRSQWTWLTEQCRINYSWTGLRIDFVDWDERADVRLQFRGGGGWIGLAEFPNGRCDDEVFCYLKPSYQPSDRRYMLNLLEHELGHNNWLQHTRGNWIMNPVINLADPDWRKDTHWSTLKKFYGGDGLPAILTDGVPDPSPDPDPPGIDLPKSGPNGVFTMDGRLMKIWVEPA